MLGLLEAFQAGFYLRTFSPVSEDLADGGGNSSRGGEASAPISVGGGSGAEWRLPSPALF